MTSSRPFLPVVSTVLSLGLLLSHASPGQDAPPAGPAEPRVVKTALAAAATEPLVVALPARTAPAEEARIYSRATGMVTARPVDIGDPVKQGDVLAEIAAPEIGFQVEAARAAVRQAEATAKLARNDLERARGLAPTRAIAAEDIDLRETTVQESEAKLAGARAELSRLESVRDFQIIRAPFSGTIADRQVDRGDHVRGDQSQAEQWLYHLVRLDELRVEVDATPDFALRVAPDASAELTFPDLPGKVIPAKVSRRSGVIDADSGTMRLELVMPNPDLAIPAGLAGNAKFSVPPRPGSVLVPGNAMLTRDGRPHVIVVKDGKARAVAVTTARNLGNQVEILSGLAPGDAVVLSPNSLLRDGDPVQANPAAAPAK